MNKKDPHPARKALRDWTKAKKANKSVTVAETHTHNKKRNNRPMIVVEGYMCSEPWDV